MMILFIVSRLNKAFEKDFEVWNHNWKVKPRTHHSRECTQEIR